MSENKEGIKQDLKQIEEALRRYLPPDALHTVAAAMNYSALAGGKRVRPLLALYAFSLYRGTNPKLLQPFLAAIEMVHTYSLVHDDLPAMDNDEFRRGRKTTHVMYGEAMAILAGDGLLNCAFETALSAAEHAESDAERGRVIEAGRILFHKAGVYGMIGGQCADLEAEGADTVTPEQLDYIHAHKTGALIEAPLMIGAALAGAGADACHRIEKAGERIGMAFQIRDDLLDVTGDRATLGKTPGKDMKNGKLTYVSLYGAEKAAEEVRRLSDEAVAIFREEGAGEDDPLILLTRSLTERIS